MPSHEPQLADLHTRALSALRSGRAREAHQVCLEILQRDPTFADAWFLCGVIAAQNGQVKKAVEILERALSLSPDNAEYHAEVGRHLLSLHLNRKALSHARAALAQAPREIPTLNTLGTLFSQLGEHEPALQCYRNAIAQLETKGDTAGLDPQWRAELLFNFATSLQFSGHFAEAETHFTAALALQPLLFKARSALSSLRKQTEQDNHLQTLEALRTHVQTPRDQLHLGHAIAKEREDLEQYDAAFTALAWAKQAQLTDSGYTFSSDLAIFERLLTLFPATLYPTHAAGHETEEPIFIVGMPRTGTTLVEQILASHSAVFAAGELQNFPLQVKRLTGTPSADVLDLATLEAAVSLNPRELGSAYLESTRPRTGHTPRFIDKLPLNFVYLGLIHRALPNAKLVCLRRDPMDTCVSNYRQLFAVDFKHYHYNYDLMTCGQYFIEFDKLMRHWQHVMPGSFHEVSYEALVAEPERHARELLAFCELEWEPQCLAFHERDTAVATPSAVQVRQGIYQSSVQRWKRYGEHVGPLHALLQSAGLYPAD